MSWVSRGRAIVVGAGLGGLCAALELARAGFEPVVFERRSELGEVNTGLSLWAFAIRRLARLGLSDPESAGGVAIEDAAVLGECLRETHDSVSALRRYERQRWRVAWRTTIAAAAFERTLMLGGGLVPLRDKAFRVAPQGLALRWLAAGGRLRAA